MFPKLGSIVGYACTAAVETARAAVEPRKVNRKEYWHYVQTTPGPKVSVIQDLSPQPGGAYWGEVNASMHKALGSLAILTNGTVRDVDEVSRLEFGFFASGVQVSHGFAHLVSFNHPLEIFGMEVCPGDLIHADRHGAVVIPNAIAKEVAEAARRVEMSERPMLAACGLEDPLDELDRLISPEY
jgi:regulator of RNase E activity RraA